MNNLISVMDYWLRSVNEPHPLPQWQPAADIYRTSRGWLAKFDLAGVHPDDFTIKVNGFQLTIEGIRRDQSVQEQLQSYSMEIAYNRFHRSIDLPCSLDQAQVTADYHDGMLLVHLITERGNNG
jgi:HSP20 family protein